MICWTAWASWEHSIGLAAIDVVTRGYYVYVASATWQINYGAVHMYTTGKQRRMCDLKVRSLIYTARDTIYSETHIQSWVWLQSCIIMTAPVGHPQLLLLFNLSVRLIITISCCASVRALGGTVSCTATTGTRITHCFTSVTIPSLPVQELQISSKNAYIQLGGIHTDTPAT